MRLALVVDTFPAISESFIVDKVVGLLERGADVHVVCRRHDRDAEGLFPELSGNRLKGRIHGRSGLARVAVVPPWVAGAVTCAVTRPGVVVTAMRLGGKGARRRALRALGDDPALVYLRPDLVHEEFGHHPVGRVQARQALGVPLTISFRGWDLNLVGLDDPHFFERLWPAVSAVHCLGEDLWARARQRGCPADMPHRLIPPAVDATRFSPSDRPAPDRPAPPLRVLAVGRLHWKKGYEDALTAVKLLAEQGVDVRYRVIGAGPHRDAIIRCIADLGLDERVTLLGAGTRELVRDELRAADVFLHAAVSEGFGNAVLEAQACAVAVVCTDADGLSENVVDGITGLVVPRRDRRALAAALVRLAHDPSYRRALGDAGRRRVIERFRPGCQIDAWQQFYETALVGSTGMPADAVGTGGSISAGTD